MLAKDLKFVLAGLRLEKVKTDEPGLHVCVSASIKINHDRFVLKSAGMKYYKKTFRYIATDI